MNKIYLPALMSFLIVLSSENLIAQQNYYSCKEVNVSQLENLQNQLRITYDTLRPGSQDTLGMGLCGDTLKIYKLSAPSTGYIGGNNSNGDLEIMQKFGITGTGGIYSIMVLFGKKSDANFSSIIGKLYTNNPTTHAPDSMINYTDLYPLAQIDTSIVTGLFTSLQFAGQIFVGDSFFAAVELPTLPGDSLAAYMTPQNCYSGKQLAYIKKQNGTFEPLNNGPGSYELNSDFWIWPVFIPDSVFGTSFISYRDLSLYGAYPNPSTDLFNIVFSLQSPADIFLELIDETGRLVKSVDAGYFMAGKQVYQANLSDLAAGNYFFSISTGHERLFSRLTKSGN